MDLRPSAQVSEGHVLGRVDSPAFVAADSGFKPRGSGLARFAALRAYPGPVRKGLGISFSV